MHPKNISIKDYTYNLPEERIARYPLEERDASKLLIYKDGNIREDVYKSIDEHLPGESLLVFNNTKVVEARLLFQKPTGGIIEVFCLEPHEQYEDISAAMSRQGHVLWKCLVGGASKWKRGQVLQKSIAREDREIILEGRYHEKRSDHFIIELSWSPSHMSFAELLHHAGAIPLPPYLKRESEATDVERYQTVYARYDGSVAAPTAGLHFTNSIFEKLQQKGVERDFVTLHVGAGTFKPVKSETMEEHEMHAEFIDVSKTTIQHLLQRLNKTIVAVGTTSLRTIESLYWFGARLATDHQSRNLFNHQLPELSQWEVYDIAKKVVAPSDALLALLEWMSENKMEKLIAKTQIIIARGYQTKIVKGLVTNFHQPNSTLLLLVAALIGDDWKKVYDYALGNNFRFLSYGDGNLLWVREIKQTT